MVAETRSAKKAKQLNKPKTIGRNGTMALVVPSATGKGRRVLYSYPSGYDDLRRAAPEPAVFERETSVETEIAEEEMQTDPEPSNRFITPYPSTILTPQPPMAPKKVVPITARTILNECRKMPIFNLDALDEDSLYMGGVAQTPTPSPTKKPIGVPAANSRPLGPQDTVVLEDSVNYEALGSPFKMQGSKPVIGNVRPKQFGPHGTEVIEENLTESMGIEKRKTVVLPGRQLRRH